MAIDCGTDTIRNVFTRGQYDLDRQFSILSGKMGVWDGKIRNLGAMPNGSGWATRGTTLGFQRPNTTTIRFTPLVGLQDDCVSTCKPPTNQVKLGNADHVWTRMVSYSENTEAFCLLKMLGDALSLDQQIKNHIRILKQRSADIMDEFKRGSYVAIARNKWAAVMNVPQAPRRDLWRFAQDANGQPDVNYIILDAGIDPNNVSLLTVPNLNYIIDTGTYNNAFPDNGRSELITDWETAQELPKYDTNVRMDNRYRDPAVLNQRYDSVGEYAGIKFTRDPFALRYDWTTTDPLYPNGVLKRIDPWTSKIVSEGCWSEVAQDYLEADFQISPFYNPDVMGLMSANIANPGGMPFQQPQSPYNGMWQFKNEVNEVTPCNEDRNLAYWRMIFLMAAKPIDNGELGHVVLHRRFNSRGPVKSCRPLVVATPGSYNCDQTCAPFDWTPPALVDRVVCGAEFNAVSGCAS